MGNVKWMMVSLINCGAVSFANRLHRIQTKLRARSSDGDTAEKSVLVAFVFARVYDTVYPIRQTTIPSALVPPITGLQRPA